MPSTFFGLSIGKTGLYANQAGINTTAHNISNATTTGYSRQVINQSAGTPISLGTSYGMIGTGVNVNSVERVRNQYYDEKYWNNNTVYGEYVTKEYYMKSIENYFSEVNSDGITATFSEFYNALQGLCNDVSNATNRTEVSQFAESFTEFVNYLAIGLQKIQEEANSEIKVTVNQINTIAAQIATLNKQINTIEITGQKANDLRDARDLLVDSLSQLGNITVTERQMGSVEGVNEYIVRLDGKTLVDTYNYNQIVVTAEDGRVNQNDQEGLYKLTWSDGQHFNSSSSTLGGKLQALFEVRDGNNRTNFTGTASNGAKGDTDFTVVGTNCNDINLLNLPESKGLITIGTKEYKYENFSVSINGNGEYEYTFHGLETTSGAAGLQEDVTGKGVKVGEAIDYKGVPYYQAHLNQFIRTFASAFNSIHNEGEDLNGNKGVDFFNAVYEVNNCNFELGENVASFTSIPATDQNGIITVNGLIQGSYYNITALNVGVAQSIKDDCRTIACATNLSNGVEEKGNLEKLVNICKDSTLFLQGSPQSFLQTFTAGIAIDTKRAIQFASHQENVLQAIDNQRMSISSVDTDEEAMNLVEYKNAYDLACKVIQVMNEMYDKLINGTAV